MIGMRPLVLFPPLLLACGEGRAGGAPSSSATGTAQSTTVSAAPSASTSAADSASASVNLGPPKPTLEKTKVPTVKEWQQGRETPILGAAGLGCDGRMVREWIRVSCRDAHADGGVPSAVEVTKGGGGDTFTFAKNGVTSILTRVLPGADFSARFRWSDDVSFPLVIVWPAGTDALPAPVGRFEGAPPDESKDPNRKAHCYCYNLSLGINPTDPTSCAGVPADAFVPECSRTHKPTVGESVSCNGLIECQRFEPSGYAECLPGEVHYGICPSCRCGKECGAGKPACPAGFECVDSFHDSMVCLEP
jgi:hypothetical protein